MAGNAEQAAKGETPENPRNVEVLGPDGRPFSPVLATKKDELPKIGTSLYACWIYGGISPLTGHPFAWAPKYSFGGEYVLWDQAVDYDPDRVQFGYEDSTLRSVDPRKGQFLDRNGKIVTVDNDDGGVRVPTSEELDMGFEHADAIGGFMGDWHWSSSAPLGDDIAYARHFKKPFWRGDTIKDVTLLVRCVRSLLRGR